jgi:D-serine deaminase-like pyridoxal phosphate-dependent protein
MARVFLARLICSDADCAEEVTAEAARAPELERLICDCGCALEILGWPDWVDEPAEVVALRVLAAPLRDAA